MAKRKEGSRQSLLTDGVDKVGVDIIGLGMHGSWTALALARLGAPRLRLWDGDTVSLENLETQCYGPQDVGQPKPEALARWLRWLGYDGDIEERAFWGTDERDGPLSIVVCCADSMETRKATAEWALAADYFIESRSAGNDGFVHAFQPTITNVDKYLANYFPETIAEVACGATGTISMGFQIASLIGSLVALTKGGERELALAVPGEHEVTLGLGHIVKHFGH